MIHEVTNSAAISADRAAAVWENEDKQVQKKTIRQWNHINCHSKKINIVDADLILWAARKSAVIHKHVEIRIFMLKDFFHHVN